MDNVENSSPEQLTETPPQTDTSFLKKLKTKWLIVLGALGSLTLFAALVYAAYSYGRRGQETQSIPQLSLLIPTTGVTVTQLATPVLIPTAVSSSPAISSEGKIAFVRDGDIWVINLDGGGEKKVATILDKCAPDSELLFSPEGNKIAYLSYCGSPEVSSDVGPGGANLFVAELDTGTIKQSVFGFSSIHELAWNSTGENFYVSEREPSPGIRLLNIEKDEFLPFVTTQEPLTGKIVIDTKNNLAYTNSWSETSRKIVSVDLSSGKVKILISVEVGAEEIRIHGPHLNFDVSPDGTKIAYIQSGSLWLYDIISGSKNVLAEAGGGVSYSNPIFSPNGRKIELDVSVGTGQLFLAFYDLNLNKLDRFGTGLSGITQGISWSADSESVVFGFAREFAPEQTTLWKMNVVTHEKIELATNASHPVCSPR